MQTFLCILKGTICLDQKNKLANIKHYFCRKFNVKILFLEDLHYEGLTLQIVVPIFSAHFFEDRDFEQQNLKTKQCLRQTKRPTHKQARFLEISTILFSTIVFLKNETKSMHKMVAFAIGLNTTLFKLERIF